MCEWIWQPLKPKHKKLLYKRTVKIIQVFVDGVDITGTIAPYHTGDIYMNTHIQGTNKMLDSNTYNIHIKEILTAEEYKAYLAAKAQVKKEG